MIRDISLRYVVKPFRNVVIFLTAIYNSTKRGLGYWDLGAIKGIFIAWLGYLLGGLSSIMWDCSLAITYMCYSCNMARWL